MSPSLGSCRRRCDLHIQDTSVTASVSGVSMYHGSDQSLVSSVLNHTLSDSTGLEKARSLLPD